MADNPIQQNLEYFYLKKGIYNEEIPLLIMNKFISYNNPKTASDIDKNFFSVNEEINKLAEILKQKIIIKGKKTLSKEDIEEVRKEKYKSIYPEI